MGYFYPFIGRKTLKSASLEAFFSVIEQSQQWIPLSGQFGYDLTEAGKSSSKLEQRISCCKVLIWIGFTFFQTIAIDLKHLAG